MAAQSLPSHSSTYTHDMNDPSPQMDLSGVLSTWNELPVWCMDEINYDNLLMTAGEYPPPSNYQENTFDWPQSTGRCGLISSTLRHAHPLIRLPDYYEGSVDTIQAERSASHNFDVAAMLPPQGAIESPSSGPDELRESSILFFSPLPPLLHMPVSDSSYPLEAVQELPPSNDGRGDDTSTPHFGALGDSTGSEDLLGDYLMEPTNSTGNYFDFLSDSPTMVLAPASMNDIPEREDVSAPHTFPRNVPQPVYTHFVASGTLPSVSCPPADAVDASDGLIKPCPSGYRRVLALSTQNWRKILNLRPGLCIYYLRDPSASPKQYPCAIAGCVDTFQANGIGEHLKEKHYAIVDYPDVTCKECPRTVQARSYQDHFLQMHSGRSIQCAYCNTAQCRVQNLPRHFKTCTGVRKYLKNPKTARQHSRFP